MKKKYFYTIILSLALFIGQILVGTKLYTAFLFSGAILFGLLSVFIVSAWNSMLGLLNLSLVTKYLLFGIVVRVLFFQAPDEGLLAPEATALVSFLGFLGVFTGTLIQQKLPIWKPKLTLNAAGTSFYLGLFIILTIGGYLGWLYVNHISTKDESAVGGGMQPLVVLGIFIGTLRNLNISAAIFYAWKNNSSRLLSHPLVIFSVVLGLISGFYTINKQAIVEPIVYLAIPTLMIKGPTYKPLWTLIAIAMFAYTTIIYPYSQYVRHAGGREGGLMDRGEVVINTLMKIATDPDYREHLTELAYTNRKSNSYLPIGGGSLDRLVMMQEADRLINATTTFTGWETITWGFRLLLPRFLDASRPKVGAENYLAHIVGDISVKDETTYVSYGFMANFYNAFDFSGVVIGSTVLIGVLYYILRLFFGNPTDINILIITVFGQFTHLMAEGSVSSLIVSLWTLLVTLFIFIGAKFLSKNFLSNLYPMNGKDKKIES